MVDKVLPVMFWVLIACVPFISYAYLKDADAKERAQLINDISQACKGDYYGMRKKER